MKILLSFLQSEKHHSIPSYSFWQYYVKNGIEESGHKWVEVEKVDWALGLVPQSDESLINWKDAAWDNTISYIKHNKVDVFLSYLYPQQIDIQAIEQIKKQGIYCINFFCDNVRLFTKAPKEFGAFNINWVPEFKAIPMFKKAGFPCLQLPMPMWIEPKYRRISSVDNGEVSFIGSKDISRHLFFEEVFKLNPNLKINIYGEAWGSGQTERKIPVSSYTEKLKNQFNFINKFGINAFINKLKANNLNINSSVSLISSLRGKPDFENYISLTRESSVIVGINRYPNFQFPLHQPDTYSRLRDLEAPMLGACYLTEWTEGLNELYNLGEEIETYRNAEEFLEKLEMLENNKQKRLALRISGQQRALSEHQIPATLGKLLKF